MSCQSDPSSPIFTTSLILSTYFGLPYGAMPISLYSPSFTSKPQYAVNAE